MGENMNLHWLKLFYVVAKTGSVTQASKDLAISQPSVTAQIKKLEQMYHVRLFQKEGRYLKLTPVGERLYKEAAQLFEVDVPKMESLLRQEQVLRIEGNFLAMHLLLPDALRLLRNHNHDLKIEHSVSGSKKVLNSLRQGRCDLAIISSDQESLNLKNVETIRIFEDQLILASSSESGLENHQFVVASSDSHLRDVVNRFCDEESGAISLEVENTGEIVNALLFNADIVGLVPSALIKRYQDGLYIKETSISNNYFMCVKKNHPQYQELVSFAKRISETLKKNA